MSSEPDAEGGADGLEALAPRARHIPRALRLRLGIGAAILLLVAALVATVAVSAFAPRGGTRTLTVTAQTGRGASATSDPSGGPTASVVYVHVLGAVKKPGLYELGGGTRVVDAVAAAGGFEPDAERGGVNLARQLSDGEQLVVPKVGEEPVQQPGASAAAGGTPAGAGAKINLNTATEPELETLPRVGPAMAARILQWRKDNGRFTSVDDLMNVTGIGDKTFAALRDLVTT